MKVMKIITNHQWRPILGYHELTEKEKEGLDYLNEDNGSFFRYRGNVYPLCNIMRIGYPGRNNDPELKEWDAIENDTFFSGILIKASECGEMVKVATFYA